MAKTQPPSGALEKAGTSDLQAGRPEYAAETGRAGFEGMETGDIILPRVALCQSGNPQRKPANPAFIEGLKEGDFFNTVSGTIYGPSVKVVPCLFFRTRMMFKPIDEGGGLICLARDGVSCAINKDGPCQHASWGEDGTKPECGEYYNYGALILADRSLAVLSFKSTALRVARQWNSLMRQRKADMFAGRYLLVSKPDRKQNQDFFTLSINNDGWAGPDEFATAKDIYEELRSSVEAKRAVVDVRGDSDFDFGANKDAAEEM